MIPAGSSTLARRNRWSRRGISGSTRKRQYTDTLGYGWQLGKISSADRKTGTALDRDLNLTADGTFVVQVPDGTYDVTLRLGDLGSTAHDQMGVFLEGNQVDTVATAAKSVDSKTYQVAVAGGQLTVRLKDLGGKDKNVAITGLTVSYVGAAAAPLAPPEGEARLSGVAPAKNPFLAEDVDGDSLVTALDALVLVNYLNAKAAGGVSLAASSASAFYLDVNGDGDVTPLDVIRVVNHINGRTRGVGGGRGKFAGDGEATIRFAGRPSSRGA